MVFGGRTGRKGQKTGPPANWWRDPLSHPDLQKMSLDQLADLPFDPRVIEDEAN